LRIKPHFRMPPSAALRATTVVLFPGKVTPDGMLESQRQNHQKELRTSPCSASTVYGSRSNARSSSKGRPKCVARCYINLGERVLA